MKSYIYSLLFALALAFLFGTSWFALFGYDPYISIPENVVAIYSNGAFWRGLAIWTVLYAVFITIPITFLKNKATKE